MDSILNYILILIYHSIHIVFIFLLKMKFRVNEILWNNSKKRARRISITAKTSEKWKLNLYKLINVYNYFENL